MRYGSVQSVLTSVSLDAVCRVSSVFDIHIVLSTPVRSSFD